MVNLKNNNIFSRFFGSLKNRKPRQNNRALSVKTIHEEMDTHGPHHYILAHVAFPQVCFHNPYEFFASMVERRRGPFLDDLWSKIRKENDKKGPATFDINEVKVTTSSIKDFPLILIEMPEPKKIPEAYFIGIVMKVPLTDTHFIENPEVKYFTLEKGIELPSKKERTFFCEWKYESQAESRLGIQHLNLGFGPDPDLRKFVEEIEKKLLFQP